MLLAACNRDARPQIQREYAPLRRGLLLEHPDETAINRAWPLLTRWTNAYMYEHPKPSLKELARAVKQFDPTLLSTEALQLENGVYLVAAAYPRSGTFFVVNRDGVLWDIKTLALAHYKKRDEIGKWAWVGFGYGDGPLVGTPSLARPSRNGNPRFYVTTSSTADWGGTYSEQISVWEWNGHEAVPLLIESYLTSFDTGASQLTPDLLTIHTKGQYKTFYSCGSCVEPEMIWKIAIKPYGVTDLGATDVVPVLRRFDDLLDHVMHGGDASDLAAPQVVRDLEPLVTDGAGMLMAWSVDKHVLKFSSDGVASLELDFVDRPNGAYFTTVRVQ